MPKHKYILALGSLILLGWVAVFGDGMGSVLWIHPAAAQFTAEQTDSLIGYIGAGVGLALIVIHLSMWIVFRLLDIVLDPAFLFDLPEYGGTGGIYNMIHSVWILSRDLVNVCFALILIAAALYIVITTKKDFISQHAPKFVMAVVFVNFSWFVPQALLDLSQITTYTVYQIPSLIGGNPGGPDCMIQKEILADPANPQAPANFEKCSVVTKMVFFDAKTEVELEQGGFNDDDWHCPLAGLLCYQTLPWDSQNLAASPESRVMNGLVVNHARLRYLVNAIDNGPIVGAGVFNQTVRLLEYVIKMILFLLLNIALFFPLLAMLAAFFVRIPILWMTMAFMPFVFLEFVYGKPVVSSFNMTDKIWKGFLSAAFLPTIVGIPISVGFILINAGSQVQWPAALDAKLGDAFPLLSGVHSFWQFLWMLMALLILWTGVFGALKSNEYTGKVVGGIESQGQALGKMIATSPMYLPFLPAPGGGKQSLKGAFDQHLDARRWMQDLEQTDDIFDTARHALRGNMGGARPADIDAARQTLARDVHVKSEFKTNIENNFFGKPLNERKTIIDQLHGKGGDHAKVFENGAEAAGRAIAQELGFQNDRNKLKELIEAIDASERGRAGGATP